MPAPTLMHHTPAQRSQYKKQYKNGAAATKGVGVMEDDELVESNASAKPTEAGSKVRGGEGQQPTPIASAAATTTARPPAAPNTALLLLPLPITTAATAAATWLTIADRRPAAL